MRRNCYSCRHSANAPLRSVADTERERLVGDEDNNGAAERLDVWLEEDSTGLVATGPSAGQVSVDADDCPEWAPRVSS